MRYAGTVIICLCALFASGCATIMTGPHQKVPVTSEPSGMALVVDGRDHYVTPVKVRLARNRDHVLELSGDGYETISVRLVHAISGAFCGNVFLGGPVGMAIDAWSGSEFKLMPSSVHAVMKKRS